MLRRYCVRFTSHASTALARVTRRPEMHRRAGWLLGRIARSHATHVAAACLLVERNRRSALAESTTPGAERVANLAAPRLRRTSSLAPQVLIADRSVEDDYILGPPLGSGTYAVVRQGTNRRTGKLVAVKQVPKTKQHTASILHEVSVLQRVSMHTCISELEGCISNQQDMRGAHSKDTFKFYISKAVMINSKDYKPNYVARFPYTNIERWFKSRYQFSPHVSRLFNHTAA